MGSTHVDDSDNGDDDNEIGNDGYDRPEREGQGNDSDDNGKSHAIRINHPSTYLAKV